MITAAGFPPGAGNVPAPLQLDVNGPGYFDVSALGIVVEVGQLVEFTLRPGWEPGVCTGFTCTAGQVGKSCLSSYNCEKYCRAGTSDDVYGPGSCSVPAGPCNGDVAFKTLVLTTN
jgi:hypothetical protein